MLSHIAQKLSNRAPNDATLGQLCTEANFSDFFETFSQCHQDAVLNSWLAEANKVATDEAIAHAKLWTNSDTNGLLVVVRKLADYRCRICLLFGHEASYCPFNAQMNRACATAVDLHTLWKKWRIARQQYVKNCAAREQVMASSAASKTRADITASTYSAAAAAFH